MLQWGPGGFLLDDLADVNGTWLKLLRMPWQVVGTWLE